MADPLEAIGAISPHTPSSPLHFPPPLAHPLESSSISTMPKVIDTMIRLENASNMFSAISEREILDLADEIEKLQTEQKEHLREKVDATENMEFWGVLQDVAGVVSGTVSTVAGTAAIYGGAPYTGGTLIASGITSIANIGMKYLQGWDVVANTLAPNCSETKEALKTYLPAGVGIVSSVLGIYGSYQLWAVGAPDTKTIAEGISNVVHGLTSFGNGIAARNYKQVDAKLSQSQTRIDLTRLDMESGLDELKEFHTKQTELQKKAAFLMQQANDAIQTTQQPV